MRYAKTFTGLIGKVVILRIAAGLIGLTGLRCGGLPNSPKTDSVPTPVSNATAAAGGGTPRTEAQENRTAEPSRDPQPDLPVSTPSVSGEAGSPVDLLRAVRCDLAVSSVYRENPFQIGNLVDGRLETAWNSKSGDLVGSWVAVRLPEETTVETLLMTVGFTQYKTNRSGQKTKRVDLFTGNHRITKVKVQRNGKEVGVFQLDPNTRELQAIPINGPGGVYRIEIVEVLPGSMPKWREICISELQIMGRSPKARPNLYIPRFATGQLPRSPTLEISKALLKKRDAFQTQLDAFTSEWDSIESEERELLQDPADGRIGSKQARDFMLQRVDTLKRLARFLQEIDNTASARLEWLAERVTKKAERTDDLDQVESAILSVLNRTDDDALRCRWAMAHGGLRFSRVRDHTTADSNSYFGILNEWDASDMDSQEFKDMERRVDAYSHLVEALQDIWRGEGKNTNHLENMKSLRSLTGFEAMITPEHDWNKLLQQVSAVEQTCPNYLQEMIAMPGVTGMPVLSSAVSEVLDGETQTDLLWDILLDLSSDWQGIESDKRSETVTSILDDGLPRLTKAQESELGMQCQALLNDASGKLKRIDEAASKKLAELAESCSKRVIRDDDFDKISSIVLSAIDRAGNSYTRCSWTKWHIELLLDRLEGHAEADYFTQESKLDRLDRNPTDEEIQGMEKLSSLSKELSDIHSRWEKESKKQFTAEIQKLNRQNLLTFKNNSNWKELMKQLQVIDATCSTDMLK